MRRIGIIGVQSLHTVYFGSLLASGQQQWDVTVSCLWPLDQPDLCARRMAEANIPLCCDSLDALLVNSDAVLLLLRDGNLHRDLAEACLKNGKPVYVDKPFACKKEDAEAIIQCAVRTDTPMLGGSTLCFLPEIKRLQKILPDIAELDLFFPADICSPHGGWGYYGSHLTDLCAYIAGCQAKTAAVSCDGASVDVSVFYPNLLIKLHTAPAPDELRYEILYKDGRIEKCLVQEYSRCYFYGMERFVEMLRSGKSEHMDRLLLSVHLLEGIASAWPDAVKDPVSFELGQFNSACLPTFSPPK